MEIGSKIEKTLKPFEKNRDLKMPKNSFFRIKTCIKQ